MKEIEKYIVDGLEIKKNHDGTYRVFTIPTQWFNVDNLVELTVDCFEEQIEIQNKSTECQAAFFKEFDSLKKIVSSIDIQNYSILTDTGFEKITKLHKTIPYKVYELKLIDGRILRCADNHIVFYKSDMSEVFVKNLNSGDKICTLTEGILSESEVESIDIAGEFEEMYDFELDDNTNHRYYTNDILSHNTAIVEGLAIRIHNKQVDRHLFNKRIIELNITSIVSGTKYRGEFEQRMEEIIKEVQKNPDVILFIDEIHNVIGAGGSAGSMDAANIIKPALARGEMRCIGATTVDEYKKVIENDSALDRRFQKVYIKIPTKRETIEILKQIKNKYEDYHGVIFSDEVLEKCVELTDRYITYRNFPDKAIDLMDEVGSRVKLSNTIVSEEIKLLEIELKEAEAKKIEAAITQNYEGAAKYRDLVTDLNLKIATESVAWQQKVREMKIEVRIEDVAGIIAKQSGIPLNKLTNSENEKLAQLDSYLNERIIGQPGAVIKVTDAIQRSRVGIQDPSKPLVSLLLLGQTGTGKTHLAKTLAKYMFDTDDSFIRFDMSEYMEAHSVSKLIGAPPGYVGHEDKGQLTEKIKNRPYCIILFDEIEKAHKDIFNILLQILDEGKLTDNHGKEVNFKNTIVIMTSNIGTEKILSERKLGFSNSYSNNAHEDMTDKVMTELKKYFRPELINRIDEKIVFQPLSEDNIIKIVDIELNKTIQRIEEKGYKISIDISVKKFLAENGYDKDYGARPLKRAIVTYIETPIAKFLLSNSKKIKPGYVLKLKYDAKDSVVIVK